MIVLAAASHICLLLAVAFALGMIAGGAIVWAAHKTPKPSSGDPDYGAAA